MKEKNLILPGNPRYQPEQLKRIFGYDNLYKPYISVEMATLETLYEFGIMPKEDWQKIDNATKQALNNITTTEADIIERTVTKHDIRALVQIIQKIVGPELARWIHVPLTSYDVIETARAMQFSQAFYQCLEPSIKILFTEMVDKVGGTANICQIGRTHGQHALPITVGFWLASILSRMFHNYLEMKRYVSMLAGKITGAVGAYNAQVGLNMTGKDRDFEKAVLEKLGLKPAKITNQILPPEPLAYYLFSCTMMSGSLAQLGRDGRNLMRTEIAEISEAFETNQVGSSTMVHKKNPINFENTEGMFWRTKNEFGKVMDTLISEHQRDLVGSCVARDFPIIVINLQQQINTLLRRDKQGRSFISKVTVNRENCQKNIKQSAGHVIAEPLYISMQMAGYNEDGYEYVKKALLPIAHEKGVNLLDALEIEALTNDNLNLLDVYNKIPDDVKKLLKNPENYIGYAEKKAKEIAREVSQIFLSE